MRVLFALLLLAAPAWADPPVVTVPATLQAKPGRLCRVEVDAQNAAAVKWWCDDDNVDLFREYTDGSISLCFVCAVAGTYKVRVIASGSKGELSDPVTCAITVGTPVPPAPPTPPTPTDPLVAALQTAYLADGGPNKATNKDLLQSLYSLAASATAKDPTLKTVGDLTAKVGAARTSLVANALPATAKAIDAYLATQLPADAAKALDDATRTQAAAAYQAVSAALGKVKGC